MPWCGPGNRPRLVHPTMRSTILLMLVLAVLAPAANLVMGASAVGGRAEVPVSATTVPSCASVCAAGAWSVDEPSDRPVTIVRKPNGTAVVDLEPLTAVRTVPFAAVARYQVRVDVRRWVAQSTPPAWRGRGPPARTDPSEPSAGPARRASTD